MWTWRPSRSVCVHVCTQMRKGTAPLAQVSQGITLVGEEEGQWKKQIVWAKSQYTFLLLLVQPSLEDETGLQLGPSN